MTTPSSDVLKLAVPMAAAAQTVLDAWRQDDEGYDEELGTGGACDLVADAIVAVLAAELPDVEAWTSWDETECHTSVLLQLSDGIFSLDVPNRLYETGGGYVWRKIEGVVLGPDDVVLELVDPDPSSIHLYRD